MAKLIAVVSAPTLALAHTGNGFTLPAGEYPVVELDGVHRGVRYITGPDDALVCVDTDDHNITFREVPEANDETEG